MQRMANNMNMLKSHCYVTSNLQFVTQKYSKCSDPYTLLCETMMKSHAIHIQEIYIHINNGKQIHTV